ncbi:MAG: hypothetical protein HRT47_03580 [Candidatus Caenarcaniphilales bacterium]|nr:hypothetical protein [Candidatus Caenarcaniphilales bacterium]
MVSDPALTRIPSGAYASLNPAVLIQQSIDNPSGDKNYLAELSAEELNQLIIALEDNGKSGISEGEIRNSYSNLNEKIASILGYDGKELTAEEQKLKEARVSGIRKQLENTSSDMFANQRPVMVANNTLEPNTAMDEWKENSSNIEMPEFVNGPKVDPNDPRSILGNEFSPDEIAAISENKYEKGSLLEFISNHTDFLPEHLEKKSYGEIISKYEEIKTGHVKYERPTTLKTSEAAEAEIKQKLSDTEQNLVKSFYNNPETKQYIDGVFEEISEKTDRYREMQAIALVVDSEGNIVKDPESQKPLYFSNFTEQGPQNEATINEILKENPDFQIVALTRGTVKQNKQEVLDFSNEAYSFSHSKNYAERFNIPSDKPSLLENRKIMLKVSNNDQKFTEKDGVISLNPDRYSELYDIVSITNR